MYAPAVNGRTLTFGVSGKLIRNSLVMYDHETGTLWSHLTGEALEGPLAGSHLEQIPSEQTTWGRWRAEHPSTLFLKVDPTFLTEDPYSNYYGSSDAGVLGRKHDDSRLPLKEKVIGVRIGGVVKAYSFTALTRDRVVDDVVGGTPIVVVFDGTSESGAVYQRGAHMFSPGQQPLKMVDASGTVWDGLSGESSTGERLIQVPITYSFWFGWADFYPDTAVYK